MAKLIHGQLNSNQQKTSGISAAAVNYPLLQITMQPAPAYILYRLLMR
jgi:hypothetical protein